MYARFLTLVLFLIALAPSSQAAPVFVSGIYNWLEVNLLVPGTSSDTQTMIFTSASPGGQVHISGIEYDLGSLLQYDLENGAPGFLTYGTFVTIDGGTGASVVVGPVSGSDAPVQFSFTDFDPLELFVMAADIDEDDKVFVPNIGPPNPTTCSAGPVRAIQCDDVSQAEFNNAGRVAFTITFAPNAGYNIVGPNTLTILGNDACWTNDGPGVSCLWSATLDVEAVPEPASIALMGAGLLALGVAARRRLTP